MNSVAIRSNFGLKTWVMAVRPKTLTAALVPVLVATALVKAENFQVQAWISICAVISALFIQIGTNFINDAIDFKKGADDANRVGPKRVTQSGLLHERHVMMAGLFCFVLATAFGVPLVVQGGWPIVFIGVLSLFCGYVYTGGPYPLAYRGLGDVFVIVFFGFVAVLGTFFLHAQTLTPATWVAGAQIGMLATVLIAVNNLRDAPLDVKVHKRTLAVRLGAKYARLEIALLALLPFAFGFYWFQHAALWAAVLPLLALPLAFKVIRGVYTHEPSAVYNQFLAKSAALHLVFGILLTVGLVLR
jgi:1,4-dihydroxy-2-naphthoate octaprenyltransferase